MRRINRRLVLLSIVFVCDVVSVFGRPQEQNTDAAQLKDDLVNRYTDFHTAIPRSLESTDSYLSTSKNQNASNVINKKEDTHHAEPDPSLRPFFQFLLNSTKRKKRDPPPRPHSDGRLVEDFINYSINDLRNPVRAESLNSIALNMRTATDRSPYQSPPDDYDTRYVPVPTYTNVPKPRPHQHTGPQWSSGSVSGAIKHRVPAPGPYTNWHETPLIFPGHGGHRPTARPPPAAALSDYYAPPYSPYPDPVDDQAPTFMTPVQLQTPVFVTPVEHQGPTFVTPISVVQAPLSDGNPPPTIVILEDIDTADDPPPLSDPAVEQDPAAAAGAGGGGGGSAAAVAAGAVAAGAGIATVVGAGAGIAGIAGGSAAAAAVAAGGGGGVDGLTPADVVQCRSDASTSKVCSQLITTASTSQAGSGSGSFLDGLNSVLASFNLFAPLSLAFWSMIFPPMSIILTSGLGVISFLFPWLVPRLWYGRQFGHKPLNRFDRPFDYNDHQPYYY